MQHARRRDAARGRKRFVLFLLASGVLVLVACLIALRERISVWYHVHRLETGQETIRSILASPPTPIEAESLHAFLRSPRGLDEILKLLIEEVDGAEMSFCEIGKLAAANRALLWLEESGRLRMDVICEDSSHHIVGYRGDDPTLRRRLYPFLSRVSRVERSELTVPGRMLSVLPFEEGAAVFVSGQGIHPDKVPQASEGAGTMAVLLEKAAPRANPAQ